ncbi:MAG: DUF432 domain-containing protein [Candidatus Kapaibacteriales bacterium]
MAISIEKFGSYEFDNFFQSNAFSLTFENHINNIHYKRSLTYDNSLLETIISVRKPSYILLQPSEPIYQHLSKVHLLIKFKIPISLFPESQIFGFALFPVALTVYIDHRGDWLGIDTFGTKPEKYALYGSAHNGIICHFKESPFVPDFPNDFDKFSEGILRLEIINTTKSFVRLNHIVLDYSFIKLFYKEDHSIAEAIVKILGLNTAETEFISPEVPSSYNRTIDLVPTSFLSSAKYLMEFGL